MKKLLVFILPFILISCFGPSNDELKKAKEEMFSTGSHETKEQTKELNEDESEKYEKAFYEVNSKTDDILIEPIDNIEEVKDQVDIVGKINNKNIDKITISFLNTTSSFPKDTHTLKQFKKGDKTFIYRAYKKYEVLDKGLNEYKIEAYSGSELLSTIEIDINLPIKTDKDTSTGDISTNSGIQTTTESGDLVNLGDENDLLSVSMPSDDSTYGKYVSKSSISFTYSNIDNFSGIKDNDAFKVTCDNLAEYLSNKFTWFYWNTCRPVGDNGVYANVLYLSGDEYNYKRVYLDKKHGIYSEVLLENGTGVTKDDLQSKNTELKTSNFDVLNKSDKLFNDLLK